MANYFANGRTKYRLNVDSFKGLDLANSKVSVYKGRSIDCENIIADLAGKPVKRTGYETIVAAGGRINGIHRLKTAAEEVILVHAASKLLKWEMSENGLTELASDMADQKSYGVQYNGKLALFDGVTMRVYGKFDDAYALKKAEDEAFIPTVLINANPDQTPPGGTEFEQVNFLTGKRYVNFVVNPESESSSFKLYVPEGKFSEDGWLVVEKVNDEQEWSAITPTSTDKAKGCVTISKSSVSDVPKNVDNVRIGYYVAPKSGEGAAVINKCNVGKLFGVGGNTNRLFLSGNPEKPNKVYYSGLDDLLYFPNQGYLTVGADASEVMGFSRVSDYLAVHKEDNGQDASVFLISGSLDYNSKPVFAVKAGINSHGAVSKYAFSDFMGEPLYLTANGVYAITTQEITFEKYAENRSFYINQELTKADLKEACGIAYNNYYYLSVGDGVVYVADGRQKVYESNQPMSSFQYEWYKLTNIPARIWWEYGGELYFGTDDGKIKRIYKESEHSATNNVYNDDGEPIKCYWCTPYFYFDRMNEWKNLDALAVMLAPYGRSGVDVYYRARGMEVTAAKDVHVDIFDFNDIDFTRFSFRTDNSPAIVVTDRRLKRFLLIQFKFENNLAEPFGIYGFEAVYTLTGRYKG